VEINDRNYATGCQRSPGKYKETARKLRLPLPLKKRCLSLPNMAVGATSGGDAPEVGLPSVTSVELPVSTDSPCTGSSITTLMTLAAPVEDSLVERRYSKTEMTPLIWFFCTYFTII